MPEAARRAAAHVFVADVGSPELEDGDRRHLRVLRLRPGETISVADGAGWWRTCLLGDEGRLEPSGDARLTEAPTPPVTVALAIPKGDRPEWAVQKLTELGVDRIVILTAQRSVVRWEGERARHHLARLRAVARAAAMQSRRVRLPTVEGPCTLVAFASSAGGATNPGVTGAAGPIALAEPGGGPPSLEYPTLAVGPEGGWSPEELDLGLPTVALAPNVLRTETAAAAGAGILVALRLDLVSPRSARPR